MTIVGDIACRVCGKALFFTKKVQGQNVHKKCVAKIWRQKVKLK